jgi:hypothetical protein
LEGHLDPELIQVGQACDFKRSKTHININIAFLFTHTVSPAKVNAPLTENPAHVLTCYREAFIYPVYIVKFNNLNSNEE